MMVPLFIGGLGMQEALPVALVVLWATIEKNLLVALPMCVYCTR